MKSKPSYFGTRFDKLYDSFHKNVTEEDSIYAKMALMRILRNANSGKLSLKDFNVIVGSPYLVSVFIEIEKNKSLLDDYNAMEQIRKKQHEEQKLAFIKNETDAPTYSFTKLFRWFSRQLNMRKAPQPKQHTPEEIAMMAVKATDAELFTPEYNKRVMETYEKLIRGEKLPDIPVDPHIKAIRDARNKAAYLEYKKHEI